MVDGLAQWFSKWEESLSCGRFWE